MATVQDREPRGACRLTIGAAKCKTALRGRDIALFLSKKANSISLPNIMPPLNLGGKNGAGRCFAKIYYTYKKRFFAKNREKVKPLCKSRRECCRIYLMPLRRLPAQQDGLHILSEPLDPA